MRFKHGDDGLKEKPFKCRKCHKQFKNKYCLQSHYKIHLKDDCGIRERFKCDHCDKIFSTKSNRNRHIKKYHDK